MRTNLYLLPATFLLLTCFQANSQITITQADMPVANDSVRVSFAQNPVDPELTGTNYSWDFSSLIPTAQDVQIFDAPLSFNFPFNLFFNSFNTSYGVRAFVPIDLGTIQTSETNNYFKSSASEYHITGIGLTINSIPLPVVYDNPDIYYSFPVNYGDLDSNDASFGFTIPGFGYYGQFIHRVNEVDGWGIVTTPFGSEACLRLKSTLYIKDTIALDTTGGGYSINRPVSYEYKWLSQGGKIPYIQINATGAGPTPTITNIIYQDVYQPGTVQIGIEEVQNDIHIQVYPNPATDYILLNGSLTHGDDLTLSILNLSGQVLVTKNLGYQNEGEFSQMLSFAGMNLSSGCYIVSLKGANSSSQHKIIIQ